MRKFVGSFVLSIVNVFQVILIEPYYEPYKEIVRLAGATVVYVPLTPVRHPNKRSLCGMYPPFYPILIL